jgi:hypothetical protein
LAFTKALYYPRIEIRDDSWLKTAILYWEEINTIVPASIPRPYSSSVGQELFEARVLTPLFVHPGHQTIERLAEKVVDYLASPEAEQILRENGVQFDEFTMMHPEKLPEIGRFIHMHPEKLPDAVRHRIESLIDGSDGDWLRVHPAFANYYMTLLASELAQDAGVGLMTDLPSSERLASVARRDCSPLGLSAFRDPDPHWRRYDRHHRFRRNVPNQIAQALLADLTLSRLSISSDTPVSDLLKFREDHKPQLGRLRTKLGDLTKAVDCELPIEALQQKVADIYSNDVAPAIAEVKDSLNASRIKWAIESFLKTSFLSVPAGSILLNAGLGIPHALLASAGVSLTASVVLFNHERQQEIRRNPFSYVLAAESEFAPRTARFGL